MLDNDFFDALEDDCNILLKRALLNKTVVAFGVDGMGQYGQSNIPENYIITDIELTIDRQHGSFNDIYGRASLVLDGYSSDTHGHAATDTNLTITLNALFQQATIDKGCWWWSEEKFQGPSGISIELDICKLLDW